MKHTKTILIDESGDPGALAPLVRLRSFAEVRNGIYTTIERLRLTNTEARIFYRHHDEQFSNCFLERNKGVLSYQAGNFDESLHANMFYPWHLLKQIPENIIGDIEIWKSKNKYSHKTDKGIFVKGKNKNLYLHEEAEIYPGCVIDTSSGPVVIDKKAIVKPFSFLEGPLYIGCDARIDNAKIGGATVIGHQARIGGEVENSLVGDYSNKHHEGFLGHSVTGRWINIGAMATTSDLKNNYGIVSIYVGNSRYSTETIKFGSLIADYCKIGIGTMLNTGTVVDFGANVVADRISGYIPPFTWLSGNEKYRLDKFLSDSGKIMSRRNCLLEENDQTVIRKLYSNC